METSKVTSLSIVSFWFLVAYFIMSFLSLAVAWGAAPQMPQPQQLAAGAPPVGTQAPQIPMQGAPIIKHLGVFGPVPGGKETPGLVQLFSPSLRGPSGHGTTVYLSSSRPDLASVPTGVLVPTSTTDAGFKVTTSPVLAPTPVTITARVGTETKTATVTVRPPVLSNLACSPQSPQQVPVGTSTTCTVWLDGKAAAPTFVPISSPEFGNQIIVQIRVPAGDVKSSREVTGLSINPGPQPRSVTVNASYGGVSKNTNLKVGPAYLKAVYRVSPSSGPPYGGGRPPDVLLHVELYAPAPSGGLPYTVNLPALGFRKDGRIPAGTLSQDAWINPQPVAADTPVQITVTTNFQGANDTKGTTVTVKAARLDRLRAYWKCKNLGPEASTTIGLPGVVGTPGQDCEYLGGGGTSTAPWSGSFKL